MSHVSRASGEQPTGLRVSRSSLPVRPGLDWGGRSRGLCVGDAARGDTRTGPRIRPEQRATGRVSCSALRLDTITTSRQPTPVCQRVGRFVEGMHLVRIPAFQSYASGSGGRLFHGHHPRRHPRESPFVPLSTDRKNVASESKPNWSARREPPQIQAGRPGHARSNTDRRTQRRFRLGSRESRSISRGR